MIDPEVMQALGEETEQLLTELSRDILELIPLHKDDKLLEPIFRLAHNLKGTSAQFELPQIAEKARVIELHARAIRSGEKELTQENVDLLKKELEDLKIICQNPKS